MIRLVEEGRYSLFETKQQKNILNLENKKTFAWTANGDSGEITIISYVLHVTDRIISVGKYRMYTVKDESDLTDCTHMELFVGGGKWQGYLLPAGLPKRGKVPTKIQPTHEIITKQLSREALFLLYE